MKVWKKIRFSKTNKKIDQIIQSYINYVLEESNLLELIYKYKIDKKDILTLNQSLADRMAGIYLLTLAKDEKRLHDIVLKYQHDPIFLKKITPEIEGYIEK